jgi:hypothetical protein
LSRHERERRGVGHTFVGRGTPRGCWRRCGRHGDCRCRGGADEIPATLGSPTALTEDGGGVGRRRGAGGEQSHRWLRLTTRSARVRGVGGVYGTVNLVISAAGPHLLLCAQGDGGPPAIWAGHPRSGCVCEGKARLGSVGVRVGQEIKLTSCSCAECPPRHGERVRGKYDSKEHISNQQPNLHCAILAQAYLLCYIETVQGVMSSTSKLGQAPTYLAN